MQWKFWKRSAKEDKRNQTRVAAPKPAYAPSRLPLLAASSASELLSLQRLIGNQAVLRIVTSMPSGAASARDQ